MKSIRECIYRAPLDMQTLVWTRGVKPSFGFEGLSEIRPEAAARPQAVAPEVDRVGERLGFGSRETLVRRRRRVPIEEPTDQLNLRAAIADINRFVEWCERHRCSYREGFSLLVAKID
jgi:hypothetical protein